MPYIGKKPADIIATAVDTTTGTFSGDIDVDGTTNLDVVDIDGAVQIDATLSVGVNDTSYDVKFFGATSGKYLLWDESADSLTIAGDLSVDGGTIKLDGNYPVATGNLALGDAALNGSISNDYNTAIGSFSMAPLTSGAQNTALGASALRFITTGSFNTAVGFNSLGTLTTASNNTAVGYNSLTANTTGTANTAIGDSSLKATTTGSYNTAVGQRSMEDNTTASNNTAIGWGSLTDNTTGTQNTALGRSALAANTTADNNTAMGYASLLANTTGASNVAIGAFALDANTTASSNVAVGSSALTSNTTGAGNTAVGTNAGLYNTTGYSIVALGTSALQANTTGASNTAVGYQALYANTTGTNNSTFGSSSGAALTTGTHNVLIGSYAGAGGVGNLTTGLRNIFIGHGAGQNNGDDDDNIAIGYETNTAGHSGAYVIGTNVDSVASNTFTFGVDDGVNRVYNTFTSNASWTRVSDERYKKNITQNTDCGLAFINDLNPVTFNWKPMSEIDTDLPDYDSTKTEALHTEKMYGLIAQEVKTAMDNNNITDFGGWSTEQATGIQAISQEMFVHPLIKAIQELSAQVTALTARITELEGE